MTSTAKCISFLLFVLLHMPGLTSAENRDRSLSRRQKPMTLKLRQDLLCDYDKTVRPVWTHKEATSIDVHFVITHVNFQEYRNTLSVECWFVMKWDDVHLQWNPEAYDDLRRVIFTADDVWTPDISVYNKFAYSDSRILHSTDKCVIGHNNLVLCVAQTTLEGNCVPDLRYWPFDRQNCTLKVGSWLHGGAEIHYNKTQIWLENVFREHGQWHLENVSQWTDPGAYPCCPNDTFPMLSYAFVLRRKVDYIVATSITPIIVFIVVSLTSLWFDPSSPVRMYLVAISIPCQLMCLHALTSDMSRPGDSLPNIMVLLRDSLLLTALVPIETMVVRWLLNTGTSAPSWLVTSFTAVVNTKPGQVLLFSELNPENAVAHVSADDGDSLIETQRERPKEWYLLGRAIDRVYFAGYILTYFILILACVPK